MDVIESQIALDGIGILTLVHGWWECKWCSHNGKQCEGFLKKLKIEVLYNPAIRLPGIYPKEQKTLIRKDIHSAVYCSIIYNSQDKEETCVHCCVNG